MPAFEDILYCSDYSEDADSAFDHAYDQAQKHNATLHIINVIASVNPCMICFDPMIGKEECQKKSMQEDEHRRIEELGGLKKVYGPKCQAIDKHCFVVRVGSPDVEIIQYAHDHCIDMIIMGTAGRSDKRRNIYIKTAANVSKFANCQVITIGSPNKELSFQTMDQ